MPPTLTAAGARPLAAPRVRSGLAYQAGLCGGTALALALLYWAAGGWVFPLDDAYITLHNARVLREGADPNYGVPALVGATSPIHLALVAGLAAVLPRGPETYAAASYLAACAGVLALASGLLMLALRSGLPRWEALILVLAGLATGALHLLNGLETGLAMAALAWVLVLASNPRPTRGLPVALGLLPFLRPELGLLSLALFARQAWQRAAAGPDRGAVLLAVALDATAAVLAAVPWLAWSWITTGQIVPSTMGAKLAFFAVPTHALPIGLGMTIPFMVGAVGPAMVALLLLRGDPLAPALRAFAGMFAMGFALTVPEILVQNGYRYAYALLPVALFALCRLAASRGLPMMRLVLAVQCLFCTIALPRVAATISEAQAVVADHRAVAAWAQAHLPAGARVLIHDAGVIADATRLPLTDLVGLKSPDSVADHRRWTLPSRGAERARALDAIARRSGATHAVILDDGPDGFWAGLGDDLRGMGWHLDPLYGTGRTVGYRLYRLTPPGGDAA